jgi:uncharacterized protein YcnI
MPSAVPRALALAAASVAVAATVALAPAAAGAHTESDLVAVAAGDTATVTLQPTHGCGDAATVRVAIRAPVPGATAGEVAGWSATAAADGDRTVLEWTGGVLPSTETGAFPVTFTVPDAVGELLTFPAVQTCEDGAELAWIDGDPTGEYPAPRLLVLPPGSAPAATIDDVPADAPGRDQLSAIVDVDNPEEPDTTTTTGATEATTSTTEPATTTSAPDGDGADPEDEGSSVPLLVGLLAVVAVGAAAWFATRGRRPSR